MGLFSLLCCRGSTTDVCQSPSKTDYVVSGHKTMTSDATGNEERKLLSYSASHQLFQQQETTNHLDPDAQAVAWLRKRAGSSPPPHLKKATSEESGSSTSVSAAPEVTAFVKTDFDKELERNRVFQQQWKTNNDPSRSRRLRHSL